MKTGFDDQMQSYIAEICIGASALRNQGAGGLLKISHAYFRSIDLSQISKTENDFCEWLDNNTEALLSKFPEQARHFGAARKAVNLFLRSAAYNVTLNRTYALNDVLPLLEIPLDSSVAKHLQDSVAKLPRRWPGLKSVSKKEHNSYQVEAKKLAEKRRLNRIDLDIFFYREEPKGK